MTTSEVVVWAVLFLVMVAALVASFISAAEAEWARAAFFMANATWIRVMLSDLDRAAP